VADLDRADATEENVGLAMAGIPAATGARGATS